MLRRSADPQVLPAKGRAASRLLPGAFAPLALLAACGNHVRIPPVAARELLITPGELVPPFDPARTEYTVRLPYGVGAVSVLASVGTAGSALTVNDFAAASGQAFGPVSLVPGRNGIRVTVTGPAARSSRSYSVTVDRAPGLQALATSVGALQPAFSPDVLEYDLALASPDLVLTPTLPDAGVAVAIDGNAAAGNAPYPVELALGARTIPVRVTSADGLVERTYVVRTVRSAPTLLPEAYAKALNSDGRDAYGAAVAAVPSKIAVGAPLEDSAAGNPLGNGLADAGAVYVLEPVAAAWQQVAMVKATNADAGDQFGSAVALAGDTLVVGAPQEASDARGIDGDKFNNLSPSSGAVYVFVQREGRWAIQAYLKASNTDAWDRFGAAVAVSGDRIAVGAPGEDSGARGVGGAQHDESVADAGAVYVFCRIGERWTQEAYLKATNAGAFDRFGTALALHGDTLVVGAPEEDSAATGVGSSGDNDAAPQSGAAYVFQLRNGIWQTAAFLKASNTGSDDGFGSAVAVHGDFIAVGAPGEASPATGVDGDQHDDSAPGAGAVYTFRRSGGAWAMQRYLKAGNTGRGDAFGAALGFDGVQLLVGAPGEDSTATGIDGAGGDDGAPDAGAAYAFVRDGDAWFQRHYVKASNAEAGDAFAAALAVAAGVAVVAAPLEDSSATGVGGDQQSNSGPDAGAAYLHAVR